MRVNSKINKFSLKLQFVKCLTPAVVANQIVKEEKVEQHNYTTCITV